MEFRPSGLRPGDLLSARLMTWRLSTVRQGVRCEALDLVGVEPANLGKRFTILYPFDRPRRVMALARPRMVRRRSWLRALAGLAAAAVPFETPAAAARAKMVMLPYQLEPALAILRGDGARVLIADEVGLGKTVQAGLILRELVDRQLARRALVLAPAGLREQWAEELRSRFDLACAIVDAASIAALSRTLPEGVNPWTCHRIAIVSLDFVKRPEVLNALDDCVWDLLIVDEAHTAASTSDRARAVGALARRARRMVLLTATPHAGDAVAFSRLCNLGRLQREEHLIAFRRRRSDVGIVRRRLTRLLRVRPAGSEGQMHALLARYAAAVLKGADRKDHRGAWLAMVVLTKRSLSGPWPLAQSLERRLALLSTSVAPEPLRQPDLDFEPRDATGDSADAEPTVELAERGLSDARLERAWLKALLTVTRSALAHDTKARALGTLLRRTSEPVIVFTEYRDTLLHLASRLAPMRTAVIHGAHTSHERRASLERFACGDVRVLLATDAASEGLNLQRRCRWVIAFELPWNPNRLEQRTGRVDRLGQERPVHALHLVAANTGEERVLARLVARARRIRAALGDGPSLPDDVAEQAIESAILTGASIDPHRTQVPGASARQDQLLFFLPGAGRCTPAAGVDGSAPSPREAVTVGEPNVLWPLLDGQATQAVSHLLGARRLAQLAEASPGSRGTPVDALLAALDRRRPWVLKAGRRAARLMAGEGRPGVLYVFEVRITAEGGLVAERRIVPIWSRDPLPRCTSRGELVRLLAARIEAAAPLLLRIARRIGRDRAAAIWPAWQRASNLAVARDQIIVEDYARLARAVVQPGLFDRQSAAASRPRAPLSSPRAGDRSGDARPLRVTAALTLALVIGD